MKVIGFNLETINASKAREFKRSNISTEINFSNVDKSKIDVLKDNESIKLSFKFAVTYKDPDNEKAELKNEISITGSLLLMVTKDEAKEFLKSWKNKEIPKDKMLPLYNFILRKCSVKALQLEEELGLQLHIPFPQIKGNPQQTQK